VTDLVEAALRTEATDVAAAGPTTGAEWVTADPGAGVGRRLSIRLHYVALPKLAAHGVVEYELADGFDALENVTPPTRPPAAFPRDRNDTTRGAVPTPQAFGPPVETVQRRAQTRGSPLASTYRARQAGSGDISG
jgi:hypothetical protein